jgi:hypothetical protein
MSDLISRSSLIEKIKERIESGIYHGASLFLFELFVRMVENAPTVEAKPVVHGEWKVDDEEHELWECSICGKVWCLYGTPIDNGMNFCPKCGADMRGGKNE